MTITLEIRPDTRDEIARQAAAEGRPLEQHAASLLERAVNPHANLIEAPSSRSLFEVCQMARGLADEVDLTRNEDFGRQIDLS